MERINVSEYFRFAETNCGFNMEFSSKVDMRKAYEAMEAAVMAIANEEGYYELWLQDLRDCCDADSFDFDSTLMCAEFADYIPAMCKAVAEAIPTVDFKADAWYNDLQCYCVDGFEISFKDRHLIMTETYEDDDCGYFCPECGSWVATVNAPLDEYEDWGCADCEEIIKISDLKFVPPTVTVTECHIA